MRIVCAHIFSAALYPAPNSPLASICQPSNIQTSLA
jgi:hypothetical protein